MTNVSSAVTCNAGGFEQSTRTAASGSSRVASLGDRASRRTQRVNVRRPRLVNATVILQSVRHAFRLVRINAGSSTAVVFTLSLAIAANGMLFTLIDAALLAPLPVRDPHTLVNVYTSRADGEGFGGLSYPDFEDLRAAGPPFDDAVGYSGLMVTATGSEGAEVLFGEIVTPNYFTSLGVAPMHGRGLDVLPEAERRPDASVVIGHRLWQRRFGGDPQAIGRTLVLNGRPFTVVGVAPPAFPGVLFRGLSADVWVPVSMMGAVRTDQRDNRDERWLFVKARMSEGQSVAGVAAAAAVVSGRLASAFPASNAGRAFRVVRSSDVYVNPEGDRAVLPAAFGVMLAGVLVLIVACSNVAGIMVARGLARQREIAIRLAIGSTRANAIGQLLLEGTLLGLFGGAGGLLLARWSAAALAAWRPDLPVPVSLNTQVDLRVALFTLALTALATVGFSLLPALRASRTPAAGSLAVAGARRRRAFGLRDALLVPQLALAVTLVAVAGLLARSLASADAVSPGFDADRTAFVSLNLAMSGYDGARAERFYERLSERVRGRAGVNHVSLTDRMPLDLYGSRSATVASGASERPTQVAAVDEEYFETLGVPIVRGRGFTAGDLHATGRVAVVSAAAASRFWPAADPVGQPLKMGGDAVPLTVIGVAADVKVQTLGEAPEPLVYVPLTTGHERLLRLVVRTMGDPAAAAAQLRSDVRALDPAVAIFEARGVPDYLAVMLYPYRLAAGLGAAFGLLTLVLAGIGLYGVLASGVSERWRELAIRSALGATPAAIVRATALRVAAAATCGLTIGAALAMLAARALSGVLFGVAPFDPAALGGTAAIFLIVVIVSSAAPVRRAVRLAPMSILRQ